MLPVMIYEPDSAVRALIAASLRALPDQIGSFLKIISSTDNADEIRRCLQEYSGISIVILGCNRAPLENRSQCIELGQSAMQRNRDNYTIFVIHNANDLNRMMHSSMRTAGVVMCPFEEEHFQNCIRMIVQDYRMMEPSVDDYQRILLLGSGTSVHRIAYSQILYMEATNKKLNIYTQRQVISVRKSLESIISDLPKQFLRCHRSFIVNSEHIQEVDYSEMALILANGDSLPISRSYRDQIRIYFDAGKQVKS